MVDRHHPERRRKPRLVKQIHRFADLWRAGGVEDYAISDVGESQRRALRRMGSDFEITKHRIRLDVLPAALNGFRIVQLTDIHLGVFLPEFLLRQAVQMVNELEPDLVALTGDFVTYSRAYIEPVAEILAGIESKQGTFAVLGNHDFRVGAEEVAGALKNCGIGVLRNRHVKLRLHGESLYVAGIDDWFYSPDVGRALRGIPRNGSTILLSHNPSVIQAAASAHVPLVLSGHTHGGQVNLPLLGNIWGRSPEQLKYKVGWGRLGPTQIYVSRGIGTIVLPVRFRCPAEIPHFTLERTPSATHSHI
jgi:predicted MPP superfamily phosphohydrolase